MNEKFETGFIFDLSKCVIRSVQFERQYTDVCWGINEDGRSSWTMGSYTLGKDLFLTAQDAKKAAEAARDRKIASLRKKLAKLESADFKIVAVTE